MNAGRAPSSDYSDASIGSIPSGLVVLHGNRLELLCEAVLQCFDRWPLAPLEDEVVLVQSNGAGEWFKATQAGARGICAGARVELPGRFAWRLYAAVLGRAALPSLSPLDKAPATWRLLRVLPGLMAQPAFAPLAAFIRQGGGDGLYQLAHRLADLFDQYQIHRPDWLDGWARGIDAIDDAAGVRRPLPAGQEWQSALWRSLLAELDAGAMQAVRSRVHRVVLDRLREGGPFADLDYTTELDIYRQALKQLKESAGVDAGNVFIFGHSMGGALSLSYFISNASFYWIGDRVAERSFDGWVKNFGDWYWPMLKMPLLYCSAAALVHLTITQIADLQAKGYIGVMSFRR